MEEVNKNTEVDNTDKKLHISDVSDSISFKKEFDDIDFELYNNRLEIYIGGFTKGWLKNEEIQNLYNFLKKYYH